MNRAGSVAVGSPAGAALEPGGALGIDEPPMPCSVFDTSFAQALARRVDEPLRARGITIPREVLDSVAALAAR